MARRGACNEPDFADAGLGAWAARSAVAGMIVDASYVYGTGITYRDITSGNNGASCLTGLDLVTGRGSWTGTG